MLVSISDKESESISQVELSKANSFIQSELFKRSYYLIYLCHKLNLYNEVDDEILLFESIKVS